MPNEQLVAHIRDEFARGVDKTLLIQSLLAAGWKVEDINVAMADISGTTPAPSQSPVPVKYAGFWLRVAAVFIDGLVLGIANGIINLVLGRSIFVIIIEMVINLGYATLMITKYQATLGKMAVGLRVERTNEDRIGFARALLREISKILSVIILGIGFLMVFWTKKKQGLHDKIADAVVVENDPTKSKTVWVVIGAVFGLALPIIAVVGIFSAVVLVSLNSARLKANDAMVKSELSTVRVHAELYYGSAG